MEDKKIIVRIGEEGRCLGVFVSPEYSGALVTEINFYRGDLEKEYRKNKDAILQTNAEALVWLPVTMEGGK